MEISGFDYWTSFVAVFAVAFAAVVSVWVSIESRVAELRREMDVDRQWVGRELSRLEAELAASCERNDDTRLMITDLTRVVSHYLVATRDGSRKKVWKSETECGAILHELFPGYVFLQNQRPAWNKNPVTKRALELDWYCEALKLAVEYQGEQHYKTVERFDGPDQKEADGKLAGRKARDLLTQANCDVQKVHLVCVPYTHKTRIREFLLADPGIKLLLARP